MPQADLERYLSHKLIKARIIWGAVILLTAALAFVFNYLYETDTQIVYHEPLPYVPGSQGYEYVEQNPVYLSIFLGCFLISFIASGFLLSHFICCRYRAIQKGEQYLTVYRGLFHHSVYVDGVEKGFHCFPMYTNVIEVWMANRVRVTVSLSRQFWYIAHVSFSDDTASVEI